LLDPLHCVMFSSTCRYDINFLATAYTGKFSAEILKLLSENDGGK